MGHYCGEMGQDFWDVRRWQREFESKQVIFELNSYVNVSSAATFYHYLMFLLRNIGTVMNISVGTFVPVNCNFLATLWGWGEYLICCCVGFFFWRHMYTYFRPLKYLFNTGHDVRYIMGSGFDYRSI